MKNKKIKINKKRIIAIIISILIIVIVAIFITFITDKLVGGKASTEFKEEKITLDFKDRNENSISYQYEDYLTVGWLQVQGTNIDFPVLNSQAASIEDVDINYLYRSSYYESGENREVILGHNIINVSSNPIRNMASLKDFEGLLVFTYDDFAKENLYISYTKDGVTELYKIYAIGFYDYISSEELGFDNDEDIKNYIKEAKKESIYDYNVDVNENDKLISLKTCTRYFGLNDRNAFIIDARKVRENEEIIKYEVKTNENYSKLADGVSNEGV